MVLVDLSVLLERPVMCQLQERGVDVIPVDSPGAILSADTILAECGRLRAGRYCSDSRPLVLIGRPKELCCLKRLENDSRGIAWITPEDCFDELFVALERVKNGEIYTGNVIRNLLGRSKREIQSFFLEMDLRKTLTKVELQVLLDVSSGYLSKQIAARRFRSIETIHTQRKVLKRKLGLTGTDHLVRFSAHMRDQIRTILYLMESPLVERIASESEE